MAERRTYQRQLLSPKYSPMSDTIGGVYKQHIEGQAPLMKMLDQMSSFLSDQGMEYIKEEATIYGATNPITLEDLEKIERGENILGKYGYGARGKIARGVAFESLANDIELAAAKDMTDYMTEAQNNDYDYETVADDLDAISLGFTKRLKDIDPVVAHNVRSKLSVISSKYYQDFVKEKNKIQEKQEHLNFLTSTNTAIELLPTTITGLLNTPGMNPGKIFNKIQEIRDKLENNLARTKLTTNEQFKILVEQNKKIDEGLMTLIVEEAKTSGLSLTSVAQDIRKGTSTSNPKIDFIVLAMSEEGRANINETMSDVIKLNNEIASIQSEQTKANVNQRTINFEQILDQYINDNAATPGKIEIPQNIKNSLNELDKMGATSVNFYKERLKNIELGHAISDDSGVTVSLDKKFGNGTIEVPDVIAEKQKLTYKTYLDYLGKARNYQLTDDIKNWETQAYGTKQYFKRKYDPTAIQDLARAAQLEHQFQKIVLQRMNAEALKAVQNNEKFDPELAYQKIIKQEDLQVNIADIERLTKSTVNDLNQQHTSLFKRYGITKVEDNLESLLAAQKILKENKSDIIEDFGQYGKQQYNTLYDKIDSRIIILKQKQ
jgi:hypothetical protein